MFLGSCQKEIEIDLNSKDPQIVIEAEVTDDTLTPQTVIITKSVSLSDVNAFPTVSGASVTLSDNTGNSVALVETSAGVYQNSTLYGYSGRTYYLTVVAEGKTFTSVCTMPAKVSFDTILVDGAGFGGGGPGMVELKNVIPVFQDPAGRGNYYRFKLRKSDAVSSGLFLFDDEVVDGGINNRPLNSNDIQIKIGDTVQIKMMCINKAVNRYFYSMSQNGSGPSASATPANPVTNIEGAILGYFSAHTVQTRQIIIP